MSPRRAGFTPQEIELDASAILQGEPAPTPVVVNDRAYTIRVRFPAAARASVDNIRNTMLTSVDWENRHARIAGHLIEMPGQTEIRRENLQRDVAVTGRLEGTEPRERHGSRAAVLWPTCICRPAFASCTAEHMRSSSVRSATLCIVLVLAVVLVFTVLLFEFGDFAAPVAILASALLSTSGVFLALLITGTTFNISSFMGLIMVIGIVAKNGILLLDADQRFRAEGSPASTR